MSEVIEGCCPGLLGEVAALHGRYYAEQWRFPVSFEAKVAREMGAFLVRYDARTDRVLSAWDGDRLLATATLDGGDAELASGLAHVRWLIVAEAARGRGLAGRLLGNLIDFAGEAGFRRLYLTTFRELEAAAALYRRFGFRITDERPGETWGRTVTEQRLELDL